MKPIFYTDSFNFVLTLWNLNYAFDKAQNKAQNNLLSDREYILILIKENPSLTQIDLAETMNTSKRKIQMLMKQLTEEGVIKRLGSKKTGSWIIIQKDSK